MNKEKEQLLRAQRFHVLEAIECRRKTLAALWDKGIKSGPEVEKRMEKLNHWENKLDELNEQLCPADSRGRKNGRTRKKAILINSTGKLTHLVAQDIFSDNLLQVFSAKTGDYLGTVMQGQEITLQEQEQAETEPQEQENHLLQIKLF